MEKLYGLLFGLAVLWGTGTWCFPTGPEFQEDPLSHNRTLRQTKCNKDEYEHDTGDCCQNCPAGTYVAEHCTENHKRGSCRSCSPGEDFLESPNGLEACLSCRVCREDQVTVQACTPKSNSVCQCKPGTYCIQGEGCQICQTCARCGRGQRIKEECTATKNTVCEDIPIAQPTSNTTRSHLSPTSITKSPDSTPEIDVTKRINSTLEKEVTKDPDPKNEKDSYLVHFISLAVLIILSIPACLGLHCYCRRREKQRQNNNQSLLANSSINPSASSSVHSTPLADRANQGVAEPPLESAPLLGCNINMDPSNRVTEHSSTQGPPSNEDPGPGGDDHGGGGGGAAQDSEPCPSCSQLPLCDCYWTDCIHSVIDNIRSDSIVRLVRDLRVPNNIIDCIIKDNPNNTYEQCYKLLDRWRTLAGKQASMERMFRVLRDMDMGGCVENIINSIKSKNIPIS